MGGEAFAFKMRKVESNRSEDMLLNANLNTSEMKVACGENAIWNGRSKGLLPESRLGEAYLFRERIEKAKLAKEAQEEWCFNAEYFKKEYGGAGYSFLTSTFPSPIEHESLIALLRGEILLNVHCYETYDLEMMVRLSHEFHFNISAFHHALEAWKVADLLAKENIGAALFADHWGYKKEAYDASVNGAKVLAAAGVSVAFKSDHPVLNSQNLIFEAAKAVGYGFPQDLAIQSVTSTPARLMGQDHRIGYIRENYDADLVIWDKNPLSIGAHPLKVFINGCSTFEHSAFSALIKV
jgi:imidazolonepropionase-like amidohydrolase